MRLFRRLKGHRFMRLLLLGGAAGALSAYRKRKLAEGERAFVSTYGEHPSAPPRSAPPSA